MATLTTTHKQDAVEFLQLASRGRVQEAFDRYVTSDFRHHNPYFRGDARSLATAMAQNAAENPEKQLEVRHVLEDGEFVAVHGRVRLRPDGQDIALVHIFRFTDDRIAELWDIGQPQPAESPNQYGMF